MTSYKAFPTKKYFISLFFSFSILTLFFILLECSVFIQYNAGYIAHFKVIATEFLLPWSVKKAILFFILIHLGLHLVFLTAVLLITIYNFKIFNPTNYLPIGIMIWFLFFFGLILNNQYFYPNSIFAEISSTVFLNELILKISLILTNLGIACLFFIFLWQIILQLIEYSHAVIPRALLRGIPSRAVIPRALLRGIQGLLILTLLSIPSSPKPITLNLPSSLPNIFIIGIDSLRPDKLSYFGNDHSLPFIDKFLDQSIVFTETLTPAARTFPAWISILSGKNPKETNIRTNLANPNTLDVKNFLPHQLKQLGYQTIYASDETRFSNIDAFFGFDKVMTPTMGMQDFLLGTFNDFPLSNLLLNTTIGKWLFPETYANRAVFHAYQPHSFINLIQTYLLKKHHKPLFFVAHFCLPHFPYVTASIKKELLDGWERYDRSLYAVDKQIKLFFDLLTQANLLNNAIVVLLSDHGEALELPGDRITEADLYQSSQPMPRFYPPTLAAESVNQSAGHGTDVLGLSQYHVLLAWQRFGDTGWKPNHVEGYSSLLDIKATLFDILKLTNEKSDGISLLPYLTGNSNKIATNRTLVWESDFSPAAIRSISPDLNKSLLEGLRFFSIYPQTEKLIVKPTVLPIIMNSKQYAVLYQHWILAYYPQLNHHYYLILFNMNSGKWTTELESAFAQEAPLDYLKSRLFFS